MRYLKGIDINNQILCIMKTKLRITGRDLCYNLERVHRINDLWIDSLIVVRQPDTKKLCIAKVITKYDNGITVKEQSNDDAPYRWFIKKVSLFNKVFLITQIYRGE